MKQFILVLWLAAAMLALQAEEAKTDAPASATESIDYKLGGLFCDAREEDLRNVFKGDSAISVAKVSYKDAAATLVCDPAKVPFAELNKRLKAAGFEIKKQFATIPIAGMDCKACSNTVYNIVMKVDGVDQATASFKEGHATAWFDPAKTNRAALVAALRKAEVDVTEPVPTKEKK